MSEKPILFNDEMVRAILDGRKTQTRRPIKQAFDPDDGPADVVCQNPADGSWFVWYGDPSTHDELVDWSSYTAFCYPRGGGILPPFGVPGDRLWVRECFVCETNFNIDNDDPPFTNGHPVKWTDCPMYGRYWEQCHYRATDPAPELIYFEDEDQEPRCKWTPSIHMPRWASRITLEVERVWVERVQDIDNVDALYEGTPDLRTIENDWDIRECFRSLWNTIYAKRGFGWDANPWVWCCEFKVEEGRA